MAFAVLGLAMTLVAGWQMARAALIAADQLGDWRAALSKLEVPRDIVINQLWRPAVVLELMKSDARLGIEGVAGDAHI